MKKTIGILREEKVPRDRRVPFSPVQCREIKEALSVNLKIQPSAWRCFSDQEYLAEGLELAENLADCDFLIGIKEVPPDLLIPEKPYLFFSHTIKKQPHNKKLMHSLLEKKVRMIDYETLTDADHNRIIGFGHFAGLVGAYNGLLGYGIKYNLFNTKRAKDCFDKAELREEARKMNLPNMRILVTGNGRVANGAIEMLGFIPVRRITPYEFQKFSFREPVYTQVHSSDYNETIDGHPFSREEFYAHPERFKSSFMKYAGQCDLLIHCSFWNPKAPRLFSLEEMKDHGFRISVIADVTCDMNGSIPSTTVPSTITDPFYGFDPIENKLTMPFEKQVITVMAIDNLPCELPRDASADFGKELIEKVLPSLLSEDNAGLIERATLCKNGKLTPAFSYLEDYAQA